MSESAVFMHTELNKGKQPGIFVLVLGIFSLLVL